MNIFVAKIEPNMTKPLYALLEAEGFSFFQPPHTEFQAKKNGVVCTLYKSGKLTVQGKKMGEFIEFQLEPKILGTFNYKYGEQKLDPTARIGIDESGKGDFFGPLCVGGIFAEEGAVFELQKLGVRDSKNLSDAAIRKIAAKIKSGFLCHTVRINPLKYNELYKKFGNLNHLLAWAHATTIETLVEKSGCKTVIIDQFASEHVVKNALAKKRLKLALTQRHRGEEDLVVAAASILARDAFLYGLEKLAKEYGQLFPKGGGPRVNSFGRTFLQKHGRQALPQVAKMHFKNLDAILR